MNTRVYAATRWVARIGLASGLALAGALKFISPAHVGNSERPWLSQIGGAWVLVAVGCFEVILALGVITKFWRFASAVSFWMLLLYGAILIAAVFSGEPPARCGCFGAWHAPIAAHFGLLVALLLLARTLAYSSLEHPSTSLASQA